MYREKLPSWLKHLDFMLLDLLALLIAFSLAFFLRAEQGGVATPGIYRNLLGVMTLIQIAVSVYAQSYKGILHRGLYQELIRCVQHVGLILLASVLYMFAAKISEDASRLILGYTAVLYLLLTYLFRCFWKWVIAKTHFSFGRRSLLIITTREMAKEVLANIDRETALSYVVAGISVEGDESSTERINRIPLLSGEKQTMEFLRSHWVDEVLSVMPDGKPLDERFQKEMSLMGLTVHTALADHFRHLGKRQVVEKFGAYAVVTTSFNVVTPGQMLVKRVMDVLGGIVGCIITGLLTLFIGPILLIKSPGPIFFAQERVGKNGKKFKIYKFRSMYMDAEERKKELMERNQIKDGMMFKMDEDPRIIGSQILPDGTYKKGIGNFIRDTSLDEFPQFFNVLKGDMSLVGTRPPTVDEWEKYELHHHARLATKPGITGMWQVSGRSKITDFEEVVRLDTQYIRQWNLGLDIKILLKTVMVVLKREGSM